VCLCIEEEDLCVYWELTPTICRAIGVEFDTVNDLLNNAGLKSLGQSCSSSGSGSGSGSGSSSSSSSSSSGSMVVPVVVVVVVVVVLVFASNCVNFSVYSLVAPQIYLQHMGYINLF